MIATNAYGDDLEAVSAAHIMPIRSFIGATPPLPDEYGVLPGGESVDDSRFVVRYFRKTSDGRLLFGGREAYTADNPVNISSHIRRQIAEIYPALGDIEITHAWGGSVGITMPRRPFVREVMPNVISAGGFSGHGVMLSNFTGRLYAEAVGGNRDRLKLLQDLNVPGISRRQGAAKAIAVPGAHLVRAARPDIAELNRLSDNPTALAAPRRWHRLSVQGSKHLWHRPPRSFSQTF